MSDKTAAIISFSLKNFNELSDISKNYYLGLKNVLKIKYEDTRFPTLHFNEKGDWIDLKCTEDYTLKTGESALINLGVAMKLPDDCEAWLVPRSGTFRKYGLIQTNGIGIIDNSFSGNNDIWRMPVIATEDITVKKGDRLCQFRLVKRMTKMFAEEAMTASISDNNNNNNNNNNNTILHIIEVERLDDTDRGGFGSSGR